MRSPPLGPTLLLALAAGCNGGITVYDTDLAPVTTTTDETTDGTTTSSTTTSSTTTSSTTSTTTTSTTTTTSVAIEICGNGVDDDLDGDDDCVDADCPDADNDGVTDYCDVCAAGDDSLDGDADGVPNDCDLCPGFDDTLDANSNGVPDDCELPNDLDGDGEPDTTDNCLTVPNPAQTDSDGDMVGDACDLCEGSNDGLDIDNDSVPNGCDQCPGSNDALDADGDTIPDGCDMCAGGDDRYDNDLDGIADDCDVCTGFSDFFDADNDTVPDGCDVCAGGDDLVDTNGNGVPDACDTCTIPELTFAPNAPAAGTITPTYVAMTFISSFDAGTPVDFTYNSPVLPFSSTLEFEWLDAAFGTICTVIFDATLTVNAAAPIATNTGLPLYGFWRPNLVANDAATDCASLDPAVFGVADPRSWIAAQTWGIGIGEMSPGFSSGLSTSINGGGGNYAADWAPSVMSLYIDSGANVADELGYVFGYTRTCENVDYNAAGDPALGLFAFQVPKATSGPLNDWYYGFQNFVFSVP